MAAPSIQSLSTLQIQQLSHEVLIGTPGPLKSFADSVERTMNGATEDKVRGLAHLIQQFAKTSEITTKSWVEKTIDPKLVTYSDWMKKALTPFGDYQEMIVGNLFRDAIGRLAKTHIEELVNYRRYKLGFWEGVLTVFRQLKQHSDLSSHLPSDILEKLGPHSIQVDPTVDEDDVGIVSSPIDGAVAQAIIMFDQTKLEMTELLAWSKNPAICLRNFLN
jgi:hypothetical protein